MKHIVRFTSIALILLFAGASTLVRTNERMRVEAASWCPGYSAEHSSPDSPADVKDTPKHQPAAESMTERNKALVLKWFHALHNIDMATALALVTDDWVIHGAGSSYPKGPEGVKQWQGHIDAMWANPHGTDDDIFAEGDRVIKRNTTYRTWRSNNKESAMTVVFICHIAEDKIAEVWRVADGLTSYQQIGAQIIMPGTNVDVGQPASLPAGTEKIAEQKSSSEQKTARSTKVIGDTNTAKRETPSAGTTESNKALVARWADAIWNKDVAAAQGLVTDDCVIHAAGSTYAKGPEGIKQWLAEADSDWSYGGSTTDDVIAEGDKVARRTTVFAMYKPNHRSTVTPVIFIYRVADGKIAEVWRVANYVSTYLQAGARIIMPGAKPEAGQAVSAKTQAEQEVLKAKQEFDDATLRNDADGRARLYTDDFVMVYSNGQLGDKAKQLEMVRSGRFHYSALATEDVIVRVYGDTAVVIERRKQTATVDGQPRPSDTRATEVWVKRDRGWRLVSTSVTPVREPVPGPGPSLPGPAAGQTPGTKNAVNEPVQAAAEAEIPNGASLAEREVLKASNESAEATRRNDVDALALIYGDDYLFVVYNGSLSNKEAQVEAVRSRFMKFSAVTVQDVIVRVYGDSAVVIKRRKQVSTVAGQTRPGDVRVTQVWVKRQGQWQLVSGQVTPILQPAPTADKLPLEHIRANGTELAYVEKGEGEPIILVHGLISDYRTWNNQMDEFAKRYHVIAYSRRYHYPNSWTGDASDYTVDLHVRDLAGLIKGLNLGPVHLIGHSYGGRVATLVAIAHPELVRTLVVAETGFASLLKPKPEWQQAAENQKKVYEAVSEATRSGGAEAGVKMLVEFGGKTGAFDQLPAEQRQRYLDNAPTLVPAWREQVQSTSNFACADASQIKAPVLWIESDSASRTTQLVGEEFARCNLQKHSATTTQEASTLPSRAEQEVLQAEKERVQAVLHNDFAALERLSGEEFIVIDVQGRVHDKADELALYRGARRHTESWEPSDVKVRVYGDTAVVTERAVVKDVLEGERRDIQIRLTHLWVKRDGRWQVVARHATRISEPTVYAPPTEGGAPEKPQTGPNPGTDKPGADSGLERQIVSLDEEFEEYRRRDQAGDKMLADDYIGVPVSGRTLDKAGTIELFRSGRVQTKSLEISGRNVRLYGDTAIVIVTRHLNDAIAGIPRQEQHRCTKVWVKRNGQW